MSYYDITTCLFYVSILGSSLYICFSGWNRLKFWTMQKIIDNGESISDLQFAYLQTLLTDQEDRVKLESIRKSFRSLSNEMLQGKIDYPIFKQRIRETVDDMLDLFDNTK